MEKLLYVRHGETTHNVDGLISGQSDPELTDEGETQARLTGERLGERLERLDLIVVSPKIRTVNTARLIAGELGYDGEIRQIGLLMERSFGRLEGTSMREFLAQNDYRAFDDLEGVETVAELQDRAAQAYQYLRALPENNILVVGHGAFGRALVRVTQGLPPEHEYETVASIGNAEIVELTQAIPG